MKEFSKPSAKIILDNISSLGNRLTTMEIKIHRFILSEFNTHRMFSRNSASSRAIPIDKTIHSVMNDPALPVYWGKNKSGMQASEELKNPEKQDCIDDWLEARNNAAYYVQSLINQGLHKQLTNRLLEPWLWHTVIVTATDWDNFFNQRCHPDAQPEMRFVACEMKKALEESKPTFMEWKDWHTPLILEDEADLLISEKIKISAARCARVSYLNHNGKRDIEDDLRLFDKLSVGNHLSPLEHVATPSLTSTYSANFKGWMQFRLNQKVT